MTRPDSAVFSASRPDAVFGAQVVRPGVVLFRLWAPSVDAVGLELDGAPPRPMEPQADGWYALELPCAVGTRYRYVLPDGLAVPDPASRAQDGDVHGASIVTDDPSAYAWQHPEWRGRPWHETVLYEMHVGLAGGFVAAARRLPALAALGITAIELMPLNDFPGHRNWGYDGVLPYAPDARYGTPDELKALVDTAHGLGMAVMLDVVYNHFGPDGNFLPRYAAPFFRDDVSTPWGAAIDFRQPPVRRFFAENALYWLSEFRFDGLRLDAVHAITSPDWLDELPAYLYSRVDRSRLIHLVLENELNAAHRMSEGYSAQWNDDGHNVLHRLLTGETEGYYEDYREQPARLLATCLGEGFVYQGQPSLHKKGKSRGEPSAHLPPTAFVLFLQNHDQVGNRALGERLVRLADARALRVAVGLQLLCPQIPLLFMGEEVGARTPFLFFTDHRDELADAVREGRRGEFAHFAAFSDPAQRARIPDPNAASTFESSVPPLAPVDADGVAWQALYKQLLQVRAQEISPRLPGARALGAQAVGEAAVTARWRLGDGVVLRMDINPVSYTHLTLPTKA